MAKQEEREIINAKIESTMLGIEDHGCLTAFLNLVGEGWGQGFGGYMFGAADRKVTGVHGMEFIRRVLEIVGVDNWENLPGEHVRIDRDRNKINRLGHITKNKWFDPGKEFEK